MSCTGMTSGALRPVTSRSTSKRGISRSSSGIWYSWTFSILAIALGVNAPETVFLRFNAGWSSTLEREQSKHLALATQDSGVLD